MESQPLKIVATTEIIKPGKVHNLVLCFSEVKALVSYMHNAAVTWHHYVAISALSHSVT